jgi:MFS family permease
MCDIYGYKSLLLIAYFVFAVGCAITYVKNYPHPIKKPLLNHLHRGTAGSIWTAIAGRFLSGAGGSGMTDMVSVIITGANF